MRGINQTRQRADVVRRFAIGPRGPERIDVDRVRPGEAGLQPQGYRDVAVDELDLGAGAGPQEGPQFGRGDPAAGEFQQGVVFVRSPDADPGPVRAVGADHDSRVGGLRDEIRCVEP